MRVYNVNGIDHKVFDDGDKIPDNIRVNNDWRQASIGEWVRSDDDCVIQVLRKGKMVVPKGRNKAREYVGTCTGTFPVTSKVKMDTSRRVNIYSFGGGKNPADVLLDRTRPSRYEHLFILYISSGLSPQEAYMKAFPTNSPGYAKRKSSELVKTKRVITAMKEELKPVLEELGIDEKSVINNINLIANSSQKDETRLKALFKLSDILDLEDKSAARVQQITGVSFQGLTNDMIDEAQRPKEIKEE